MKCPACRGQLVQVRTKTAVLDRCEQCKGIWFDEGKFGDFIKKLSQNDKVATQKVMLFHKKNIESIYNLNEKERPCPKCGKEMKKFNYAGDSNVFLDKCPGCEGIWADKGEALAIASYLKEDPIATAVGQLLAETSEDPIPEMEPTTVFWFAFFPKVIVPLGSDLPPLRIPVVTISLIVLGVLFFVYRGFTNPASLSEIWGVVPEDSIFDVDLLSSLFLVGSGIHLIWDMVFLWLFGGNVEDRLGRVKYSLFFVSCGLLTALVYGVSNFGIGMVTVGISGAVAAVMGAYFIFYPISTIRVFVIFKTFEVPAAVLLGAWIVSQMVGPFLPIAENVPKTAWVVTIFGFFAGVAAGFVNKSES